MEGTAYVILLFHVAFNISLADLNFLAHPKSEETICAVTWNSLVRTWLWFVVERERENVSPSG